jgi:hypothetical protein
MSHGGGRDNAGQVATRGCWLAGQNCQPVSPSLPTHERSGRVS